MILADSLAHAAGCGQNYYKTLLPFLSIRYKLQEKKYTALLRFPFKR